MNTQQLKDFYLIVYNANITISDILIRDREIIKALYPKQDGCEDNQTEIALNQLQRGAERLADTCEILARHLRDIRELKHNHELYEELACGKPKPKTPDMTDKELDKILFGDK